MRTIEYTLETKTPIILTYSSSDENTIQTRDYIPGYVTLGALATQYLKNRKPDENFQRLFLTEETRFCDATISKKDSQPTFIAPMAIQKQKDIEKYYFMPKNEEKINSSAISKYLLKTEKGYEILTPEKGIHFHINTAIKEKDEEGGIFHYEFIKSGQYFKGIIKCEDYLYNDLSTFLDTLQTIHIGRSKNTEYGSVQFSYKEHPQELPTIKAKSLTFFFTTPVILRNEYGYYEPSLELLEQELKIDAPYKITNQYFKTMDIENYRSIWGMKTPVVKAFQPGSSFTMQFTEPPNETAIQRIHQLLEKGIGCRKNEGFGEIAIIDIEEKNIPIYSQTKKENNYQKPKKTPPFMEKVINKITETELLKVIDEKVLFDGEAIREKNSERIPTNSLLSKIEMMVKDSQNFEAFKTNKIQRLRTHATKQLEKCRTNNGTLYQILNGDQSILFDLNEVREYLPNIEERSKEFKYTQRYISGLMRRLRKIQKEKKDGE